MSQEYVSIPVPKDRVQEVYELLARPARTETSGPTAAPPGNPRDAAEREDMVIRIYRESPDTMKSMLKVLASRAGHTVPMEEVAKGVNRTPKQMSGALGAFGRRFKHRYAEEAGQWPFEAWWNFELNTMMYRMSPRVADVINKLP